MPGVLTGGNSRPTHIRYVFKQSWQSTMNGQVWLPACSLCTGLACVYNGTCFEGAALHWFLLVNSGWLFFRDVEATGQLFASSQNQVPIEAMFGVERVGWQRGLSAIWTMGLCTHSSYILLIFIPSVCNSYVV